MKIFFSVGEPSGDLHGANLIRELRREHDGELELVGYGGPEMAAAGCQLHTDLTQLAVMWIARVLLNIHKFWNLVGEADRYFRHHRPDAVVLIDYPGFNWWIARRAKVHGIPVIYYGAPQIWGWAPWRIKKMRRLVDHVLCKLPFEEPWYRERNCNATYVGHPFFDEVRRRQLDPGFLQQNDQEDRRLVAILPGSRTQEVTDNLKWLLKAAALVHQEVPDVRFAVAAFKPQHQQLAEKIIAEAQLPADLDLQVHVKRTPELIHLADCCMAVSGSVSLELLYHTTPTVILYWISRAVHVMQSYIRKVKYITLVNLLATKDIQATDRKVFEPRAPGAEKVPFPEYLTSEDRSADIAFHVIHWLTNSEARNACVTQLSKLKAQVADGGASRRGAQYILRVLRADSTESPRPHFRPLRSEEHFQDMADAA